MDGTHDLLKAIASHTAITIEQVADIFQVSAETIRRVAVRKQIGGASKFGGSRFNPACLGYWLCQRDPLAAQATRSPRASRPLLWRAPVRAFRSNPAVHRPLGY
jgi:hypothetical protein